jgi:hypothetical protein
MQIPRFYSVLTIVSAFIDIKNVLSFKPPMDSPPGGGGRLRCSCGCISHMHRSAGSGERVRMMVTF